MRRKSRDFQTVHTIKINIVSKNKKYEVWITFHAESSIGVRDPDQVNSYIFSRMGFKKNIRTNEIMMFREM